MNLRKFFIFKIIILTFTSSWQWDSNYLKSFVTSLNKLMHAQEEVWFVSELLRKEKIKNIEEMMINLHNSLGITRMVFTNRSDLRISQTSCRRNIISMVFPISPEDPILEVHSNVLHGNRLMLSIITPVIIKFDRNLIEKFLIGMKERNFLNSMLYVQTPEGRNELYGYSLYPKFEIENRTDFMRSIMSKFSKLALGFLDTGGAAFSSPLKRQNLPGVFWYKNYNGLDELQGTSYQVLKLFMDSINATLLDYDMPKDALGGNRINMKASLDLVRSRNIPILAHAYALYDYSEDIDKTYPIMVVKWCLMVPRWNSVSTYLYPLQPFHPIVWYAWLCSLTALVMINIVVIIWKSSYLHSNKMFILLCKSVINDFCTLINIPPELCLKCPPTIQFVIQITIFFFGFFLSANYTSLLGSILTVSLYKEQINTMEDIINANITVMIIDYEMEFLLSESKTELPLKFLKLLLPLDYATFNNHQESFNTSYAYFITEDKWHFLELQQASLKDGIFRFTDICFGSYHLTYALESNSPIQRNLKYFMYRVHSSGLLQYYERIGFDRAVHSGLVKRFTENKEYNSAGLDHLVMIFALLLMMSFISVITLLLECLMFKLKQ